MPTGRLFGAPPAQTIIEGSHGYAPAKSNAPTVAAQTDAASLGARTPEERAQVTGALSRLGEQHSTDGVAQAVTSTSPTLSALAARAGGMSPLATALGFSDAGQLAETALHASLTPQASQSNESAPTDAPAPISTLAPTAPLNAHSLGAATPDEAQSVNAAIQAAGQRHGEPKTQRALGSIAPTLRALAPSFASGSTPGLTGLSRALSYADAGALTRDMLDAQMSPPVASEPNTPASLAPLLGQFDHLSGGQPPSQLAAALGYADPGALSGAIREAASLAQPSGQPAPSTPRFIPAAVASALPLATTIMRSPDADAMQQSMALGAMTPDEVQSVAGAVGALSNAYGSDATRSALTQLAPSVHAVSANAGLSAAAGALGYTDAGTFVGAWAESQLMPQFAPHRGALPASAPLFKPAMPSAPSETPVQAGPGTVTPPMTEPAMQSLVAGHGQDAAHAAVQSVQPTLAALAARYDDGQGGTGWDGLAARLGYADAGSLIAGVAGQHLASPTPIATPPPSPTPPAPTIPAQLGARTADETRAVGNVAQMLTAAYGEAAIQQATQSVAPITSALASHLPATESTGGMTALAQSLGFPDAGRMAGALLEDHAMRAQGLTPPEHGALFGAPLPAMPATPDPAPPVTTTTPPNLALAAHALSLNTPPERPVPFDQVAGMRMAQNLNLPPNFGPVLSNLAWSLRAQSADPGLFWQVYQGAEEIGNDRGSAGGDSGDAYAAFRQFVDELYDRQGDGAPFHRPWRPGEQPLPGRRTT